VVRQKAVKEDDSAKKQWPLKITVGERKLCVRAATKKERHSWYLFLASKIAHLNYLKSVEASGNRVDTRFITLFNSEAVTDLHLDHRPIPEEAAVALAKTLPAHDETESLSLINASLNDAATKHIGEVLEKLSIKSLNLSRNKITSAGIEELTRGIAANASLTELNLEDNQIDNAGIATLAGVLAQKPAITQLNLNGNLISAAGVRSLTESLSSHDRAFPYLHLARNQLGDAGAAEVSRLVQANPSIIHLNLSGNGIGDQGLKNLTSALGPDSLVVEIDLSKNNITSNGVQALEQVLNNNHTLAKLDLSNNKILGSPSLASLFKEGFAFPSLAFSRDH